MSALLSVQIQIRDGQSTDTMMLRGSAWPLQMWSHDPSRADDSSISVDRLLDALFSSVDARPQTPEPSRPVSDPHCHHLAAEEVRAVLGAADVDSARRALVLLGRPEEDAVTLAAVIRPEGALHICLTATYRVGGRSTGAVLGWAHSRAGVWMIDDIESLWEQESHQMKLTQTDSDSLRALLEGVLRDPLGNSGS